MNDDHQFTEQESAIPLPNGKWWVDCWNCQGESARPEDNVVCDICEGEGGWERDYDAEPEEPKR